MRTVEGHAMIGSRKSAGGNGPAVLRFKARLAATGSAVALTFPKAVSEKMRGMTNAEGTINGHPFRATLEKSTSGSYSLQVNKAMLRGACAAPGDTVNLAVLGPEPKLTIPADLRAALASSTEANTLWKALTPFIRRDWVRWIEGAKTPETRARRVSRTIEQLAEGKRRPCCVNFYEYMLRYIDD